MVVHHKWPLALIGKPYKLIIDIFWGKCQNGSQQDFLQGNFRRGDNNKKFPKLILDMYLNFLESIISKRGWVEIFEIMRLGTFPKK